MIKTVNNNRKLSRHVRRIDKSRAEVEKGTILT